MDALLLAARCMLAVVFLVAAVGKFLDVTGARRALEEFGAPPPVARVGGLALPCAELAVAVALLIRPSARWGAVGALLLLLVFIGGVARAMSHGRAPDCHCFGQIHSEPAGRSTLIRNILLAAPAVLIIVAGSPTLDGGLGNLDGTQSALVATAVLAIVLALALVRLWSGKRRLERELALAIAAKRPPGLPRGTAAPEFVLRPVRGEASSLSDLMEHAMPAVLVFVTTTCGPCLEMLPMLARWQQSLADSVTLSAIFSGEAADIERLSEENELGGALAQEDDETFIAYALRATPSAVLIDPDGVIAAAPAQGVPAIEALIRSAIAKSAPGGIVVHSG